MPNVIVALYPGCTHGEIVPLLQILDGAATVRTLGPTTDAIHVREGYAVAVDGTFASAGAAIDLLVLPGGDPITVLEDGALFALVRASAKVAAICNGVLLAGLAGVTRGRTITHVATAPYATSPTYDELLTLAARAFEGARWVDEDVVVDGPLVTAKPWAAIDFAKRALVHAGLLERTRAASRARYLRGFRDASHGPPYERWAIALSQIEGVATVRDDVVAHVEHLRALERNGLLELAGPFPEHASGLVVVRARSRDEAEAIAAHDPFVSRGVRRAEVRRWLLSCDDDDHLLGAP